MHASSFHYSMLSFFVFVDCVNVCTKRRFLLPNAELLYDALTCLFLSNYNHRNQIHFDNLQHLDVHDDDYDSFIHNHNINHNHDNDNDNDDHDNHNNNDHNNNRHNNDHHNYSHYFPSFVHSTNNN